MMIGRLLAAVAITYVLGLVSGFQGAPRYGRSMINGASRLAKEAAVGVLNVKPDLFSDDLFEDDEEEAPVVSNVKNEKEVPKKKYLEEKWKLNSEDQKEFKGFDGSNV